MVVYVIHKNGKPLMPCSPRIARLLLRDGNAKVIRRTPFTIKLLHDSQEYTQPLTLGVDTGSSVMATSVVNEKNEVLYVSEIIIRNNIKKKMTDRSGYRRLRRSRKLRYRQARFDHRKNSIRKDRFPPTMTSKIDSHIKEINFVKKILLITDTIIEVATFDPHALKNPAVLVNKQLYQQGTNYGFANTRAFVLHRDGYICRQCNTKATNTRLEVHHIIPRANQGSDDESNLITLCETCHADIHNGIIKLKAKGKPKGNLSHATQMNSIRIQLTKRVNCKETFGFITKEDRYLLGLPKEHIFDAVAISCLNNDFANKVNFKTNEIIVKRCIAKGDYKQTQGERSEQKLNTGKVKGFRKFDKVKYRDSEYFIKGKMATGYAVLMDIYGTEVKFNKPKTAKFEQFERIEARKSWMLQTKIL